VGCRMSGGGSGSWGKGGLRYGVEGGVWRILGRGWGGGKLFLDRNGGPRALKRWGL